MHLVYFIWCRIQVDKALTVPLCLCLCVPTPHWCGKGWGAALDIGSHAPSPLLSILPEEGAFRREQLSSVWVDGAAAFCRKAAVTPNSWDWISQLSCCRPFNHVVQGQGVTTDRGRCSGDWPERMPRGILRQTHGADRETETGVGSDPGNWSKDASP